MATAFGTPIDYYNLDATPLKLKSSNENKTSQTKEATNARGDNIARDVYGERSAPTCDFEVIAAGNISLVLGSVNTENSVVYMLTGGTITTKANTPPAVSVSGTSLQSGATVSSTVTIPDIAITKMHKAQILASAFTLGGTGCELNECTLEISSRPSFAEVNGVIVAHDIAADKMLCKAVIVQTVAGTPPTITASEGWAITKPLTTANPDADYPTWTAELSKDLTSVEPV
jgi:hypothetical protein